MPYSVSDIALRLRRVLPPRWAASDAPILTALLSGMAAPWVQLLADLDVVRAQTRLRTATGDWLDARVEDFLGFGLPRRPGEADAAYGIRAGLEVLRPRVTRAAVIQVVSDMTGQPPVSIFEPTQPRDAGCYGRMAYGRGKYGSRAMPFQFFVDLKRPAPAAALGSAGYGRGAYGHFAYVSRVPIAGAPSDADLYAGIASVLPSSVTAWTRLI